MRLARSIPPAVPYGHLLDRVDVLPQDWPEAGSLCVTPVWKGVDRPQGTAYALPSADRDLAERLGRLILSGGAYASVEIRTDIHGNTYVNAEPRFAARTLARDLAALGA